MPYDKTTNKITNDELLSLGMEMFEQHGRDLTFHDFCRYAGISTTLISHRFGTWRAFRERLGVPPRTQGNVRARIYTPYMLIDALRELYEKESDPITLQRFREVTGISYTTIARLFGSWFTLRQAADLPKYPPRTNRYPDEDLLNDLLRVARIVGRAPTIEDYTLYGTFGRTTLTQRFGNWREVKVRLKQWLEYRAAFSLPDPGLPRVCKDDGCERVTARRST